MENNSIRKFKLVITKESENIAVFPQYDTLPDFTNDNNHISQLY